MYIALIVSAAVLNYKLDFRRFTFRYAYHRARARNRLTNVSYDRFFGSRDDRSERTDLFGR